jgi:hypothetical protein
MARIVDQASVVLPPTKFELVKNALCKEEKQKERNLEVEG